jgi:hypothetical protein
MTMEKGWLCGVLAAGFMGLVFVPAQALAVEAGPQWTVTSVSAPTNFKPDSVGEDMYWVAVTNTGSGPAGCTKAQYELEYKANQGHPNEVIICPEGSPVTNPIVISDELPEGLALDPAGVSGEDALAVGVGSKSTGGANFKCVLGACTYTGLVVPDDKLILKFPVDVAAGAPAVVRNVVRVSGGGALDASLSARTSISETPAGFGISPGGTSTALSSTQAGAHPDITTSIAFNTVNQTGSLAADPKDLITEEPSGFAGDLVDTPTCSPAAFNRFECPIDTQIGVTTVVLADAEGVQQTLSYPVYNLAPNPGEVAKFGFVVLGSAFIQGDVSVRPGDYGLTVAFHDTNETLVELDYVSLTVWGVPAAASHDPWRWNGLLPGEDGAKFGSSSQSPPAPYFTNPTSCEGEGSQLEAVFRVTSWQHPSESESPPPTGMRFGPIVGCDRLGFPATFTAAPTTVHASAPTGLDVNLGVKQTYENPEGLATSTLRKAVVRLPEGMTVNPSAGTGLGACGQGAFEEEALEVSEARGCPNDSTLGSVEVVTPALKEKGVGTVFLAEPAPFGEAGRNPFDSLIALYVVIRFPERGVVAKLAGEVKPNPVTGQLTTTFEGVRWAHGPSVAGLPPVPFSAFVFKFIQGPTAPLVNPPACGSYQVSTGLTPWSAPEMVLGVLAPPFSITQGPGEGSPCPPGGVPPFKPGISAGTLDNDAGSYSSLDLRITREDGEQEITGFSSQLPPGLTANLTGVPFCSEADIALARTKTGHEEEADPACPAASEIGHTLVGAGVGSVLAYAPGKVYMAGPFEGAPFSIAAITSADVGPFDLGTVVVHLPLDIDPVTAAVSIPAGAANQIPHIIKGIVVHVRDIRVYIDKPNFTLNPTSCDPMTFSATVTGGGADPTNPADNDPVTASNPFQAADCSSLKFAPKFTVTTSGKTSKANGASLTAKLTYPTGSLGQDANIKQVKVDLPKQLPSRLTTLQKACTAAQFNANPAGCPAASLIGSARAITPILPVPLVGPAYFVSHGGEAFPDLEIVLQGYGVTIVLTGNTFISKAGITSSTFKTVPDQPVSSFELTLPQGPYSALAANGNLCSLTKTVTVKKKVTVRTNGHKRTLTRSVKETAPLSSLQMPTEFVAQNGAEIHQNTPIAVTGCAKTKPTKKTKTKTKKHTKK